ncbi:MAG: hypothetical protein FWB80_13120 [Defluviitaleaceae bacterium]|nr:hypothetical protein [Defluviitaleaceae bacterium]
MNINHHMYEELSNKIFYKGFTGIINYCNQGNILYGCVISGATKGVHISYHGNTIEECINDFHEAIDFHLLPNLEEHTLSHTA